MKPTSQAKLKRKSEDLRTEYQFDYSKAKANRFAGKSRSIVVLLDADVSAVFKNGETVNAVLRSVISAMPPSRKRANPKV